MPRCTVSYTVMLATGPSQAWNMGSLSPSREAGAEAPRAVPWRPVTTSMDPLALKARVSHNAEGGERTTVSIGSTAASPIAPLATVTTGTMLPVVANKPNATSALVPTSR